MTNKNYQSTIYACFAGYIIQAVVNNFVPLLFLTFRSGISLYQKILGWVMLAGLVFFYQTELTGTYKMISGGEYKTALKELAGVMQVAMPALAFALFWSAFVVSSAMDAGKILVFGFLIFLISTGAKIALML